MTEAEAYAKALEEADKLAELIINPDVEILLDQPETVYEMFDEPEGI